MSFKSYIDVEVRTGHNFENLDPISQEEFWTSIFVLQKNAEAAYRKVVEDFCNAHDVKAYVDIESK